jgi:hypothetical protein
MGHATSARLKFGLIARVPSDGAASFQAYAPRGFRSRLKVASPGVITDIRECCRGKFRSDLSASGREPSYRPAGGTARHGSDLN